MYYSLVLKLHYSTCTLHVWDNYVRTYVVLHNMWVNYVSYATFNGIAWGCFTRGDPRTVLCNFQGPGRAWGRVMRFSRGEPGAVLCDFQGESLETKPSYSYTTALFNMQIWIAIEQVKSTYSVPVLFQVQSRKTA